MAVRRFNSPFNNAFITLAIGALQGINSGPFTYIALVRPIQDGFFRPILSAEAANVGRRSMWLTSTDLLMVNTGGSSWTDSINLPLATGWGIVAVTKETAGDTAARLHFAQPGSAFAGWTHQQIANPSATMPDDGATVDNLKIGHFPGSSDYWVGDVAVAAAWNGLGLQDGDIEGIETGAAPWLARSPDGMWLFTQESVAEAVVDVTGNAADQTTIVGTTVLTGGDPDGFDLTLDTVTGRGGGFGAAATAAKAARIGPGRAAVVGSAHGAAAASRVTAVGAIGVGGAAGTATPRRAAPTTGAGRGTGYGTAITQRRPQTGAAAAGGARSHAVSHTRRFTAAVLAGAGFGHSHNARTVATVACAYGSAYGGHSPVLTTVPVRGPVTIRSTTAAVDARSTTAGVNVR